MRTTNMATWFNIIVKNVGGGKMSEPIPLFVLDSSIMTKIIEGKETEEKLIKMISKMKTNNIPFEAVTTLNSFKRAIWKAESESNIKGIQELMDIVKIIPTRPIDYRNEKEVMDDIIDFASSIAKVAGCKNETKDCDNCPIGGCNEQ